MFFQIAAFVSMLIAVGALMNPNDNQFHWLKIGFVLCFGFSMLFGTLHSLRTNSISGDNGTFSRDQDPKAFLINIVAGFILSAAVFGFLIFLLMS